MFEWLQDLFLQRGFAPHGYCLLWDPRLIWTHVISDAVIAAAYFSIPIVLWIFLRRRPEIEFGWVLGLFAVFILACGTTHLFSILVLWVPAYGLEGAVKVATAAASIFTAAALWPLLPKLTALPSPAQLQAALDRLKTEAAERELKEEMLRQSQKMEAVGQLTAGIAHDFNNLLTVITGSLDRALRFPGDEAKVHHCLQNALLASESAATLTNQLLSFARKQPMIIEQVDLNRVLSGVLPLLRRTLGENVSVTTDLAPALSNVDLDRNQFENALINVALNARDAMPGGTGKLAISTIQQGGQVIVSVADNGSGMDAETVARATEPFFTTKTVGSGTGLGLSQVFGFVSQMNGSLEITSEVGFGTNVRFCFPHGEAAR